MRARTRQRILLFGLLAGALGIWNLFFYRPKYEQPSAWERHIHAAMSAMARHDTQEAEVHLESALRLAEGEATGSAHIGTTLHNLANLRMHQNRYADAEKLLVECLAN